MPDRVRIEHFEAKDVERIVNNILDKYSLEPMSYMEHLDAEDLVNAIGEIYEAALIRMRRAALT